MDVNRRWVYKGTYVLVESVPFVFRIENNGRTAGSYNTQALLNIGSLYNKITPVNYHFLQLI
jgi:hypothetical protein